ncbi:Notchless protein [Ceratobasidium sp. AG-Ba]|nr:Notchless protein [Ceratobasidium sp. AG-Ba]
MPTWTIAIQDNLLRNLDPVKEARYNSSAASQVQRTACTPNTRRAILAKLDQWASDPSGAKIYWMNGMAGTGKTTIAYSLCARLQKNQQLAASFFCSRTLPRCRDVARIVPTIAYQMALLCPAFKEALCMSIRNEPDIADLALETQFEKLLRDPLQSVAQDLPKGLLVVVVDALDELSERSQAPQVLDNLIRLGGDWPIKFFLTCRPSTSLINRVLAGGESRLFFHLHEIEKSLVQADIETYLQHKLQPAGITAEQVKRLADLSGPLFIYASTAVQYIRLDDDSLDHQERLQVVLGASSSTGTKAQERLNELYRMIVIKLALCTIICAREPLTLNALAHLLEMKDAGQVRRAIEPLRSVVRVDEESGLVSTLHASFPDYMLAETRSGDSCYDARKDNLVLSRACFKTMKDLLRFNICNLESSFVLDEDVSDLRSRVEEAIPLHLNYACRYWLYHMKTSGADLEALGLLEEFLNKQLLFWLECLNLSGIGNLGTRIMSDLCSWVKATPNSQDVLTVCYDALRFVIAVAASDVGRSTPHIYVTVLALWDRNAPIWKLYGSRMRGAIKAIGPTAEHKSLGLSATWQAPGHVRAMFSGGQKVAVRLGSASITVHEAYNGHTICSISQYQVTMAISPDGTRIVSGSYNGAICIWDAQTGGAIVESTKGHTDFIRSVRYSPSAKQIASSSERTICIWDAVTARLSIGPIEGHACICSIAYPPDGQYLAAGYHDGALCILNTHTGVLVSSHYTWHRDRVTSVGYSPNGRYIASGSHDRSIIVCDARTWGLLDETLQNLPAVIGSVVWSPDSCHILYCLDNGNAYVYDPYNHQHVAGPFVVGFVPGSPSYILDSNHIVFCQGVDTISIRDVHANVATENMANLDDIYWVEFSSDGSRIFSCTERGKFSFWDAQDGMRLASGSISCDHSPTAIALSPHGNFIAAGYENGHIIIWDAQTATPLYGPYSGHANHVQTIVFSPDGVLVASGSLDGVYIRSAHSGHLIINSFAAKGDGIPGRCSVAFSPAGNHLACSTENLLQVWDVATGIMVMGPFQQIFGQPVYSPNGRYLAHQSNDDYCSFLIRDARTGDIISSSVGGNHGLAFSPDGRFLTSAEWNNRTPIDSIYVCDAQTGVEVARVPTRHLGCIILTSFSRDRRLYATGSLDGSIRVWDVQKLISSKKCSGWVLNEDGWITLDDGARLLWVSKEQRKRLKLPQMVCLIHENGQWELDFDKAFIGKEWTMCYESE